MDDIQRSRRVVIDRDACAAFLKQTQPGSLPRMYLLIHYISREGPDEAF